MKAFRIWIQRARRRVMFMSVLGLVRIVGFSNIGRVGTWIADAQFGVGWSTRRRLQRELAVVLHRDRDDPILHEWLHRAYRVNTVAALEVLSLLDHRPDDAALEGRCRLHGVAHLETALARGRGAILLATHSGNGLLAAITLARRGFPVGAVYHQPRMMPTDHFASGLARHGIDGIRANDGVTAFSRVLSSLRRGNIVFVMMDQGVKRARDGVMMDFLGKVMAMPTGPAHLARHGQSPVLPLVTLAGDPVWSFEIKPSVDLPPTETTDHHAKRLLGICEAQIRAAPQLWSWHQRRWRDHALIMEAPHDHP